MATLIVLADTVLCVFAYGRILSQGCTSRGYCSTNTQLVEQGVHVLEMVCKK